MTIPFYSMPVYIPRLTKPEDWVFVKFPGGESGYVESVNIYAKVVDFRKRM